MAEVAEVNTDLVINEIDYDQAGTDAAEFVELKNNGSAAADLAGWTLELINGTGGGAAVYQTFDLSGFTLAAGDYFVVCANPATVDNCDLDVTPETNLIQNGAPDAVALWFDGTLIDAVSYEGDTGAPYTEGSGVGLVDDPGIEAAGISRYPDGIDTDSNNLDLSPRCSSPGAENVPGSSDCVVVELNTDLVINEIDYDQASTDTAEFVELKNNGTVATDLTGWTLELINGTGGGAAVYNTIELGGFTLAAGDYFVVCANAGTVENCDLDSSTDTNLIQNGAPDAVALWFDGTLIDAVSYEGDTGAPYTEGSGVGLVDDPGIEAAGISRYPDGTDTNVNNLDLSQRCISPGAANRSESGDCGVVELNTDLVINEIDYDQASTDTAEFIELKNNGSAATDLTGWTLELVNGSSGGALEYNTIDLSGYTLAGGDYFVVCANPATVENCDLDSSPDTNFIQNGAPDAVALWFDGTLIDAVSYEGDTGAPYTEGSGVGLEDDPGIEAAGISRYPDGTDTDVNHADLSLRCISPGAANVSGSGDCVVVEPNIDLVINEIDYDQPGTDAAEYIELRNNGDVATDLTGWTLALVNGNGAADYKIIDLSGYTLAAGDYFVVCAESSDCRELRSGFLA